MYAEIIHIGMHKVTDTSIHKHWKISVQVLIIAIVNVYLLRMRKMKTVEVMVVC